MKARNIPVTYRWRGCFRAYRTKCPGSFLAKKQINKSVLIKYKFLKMNKSKWAAH